MPETAIVDTNVVLVANGQHTEVSPGCVADCALKLQGIMRDGRIAIDDGYLILHEYLNKTKPNTGNRPGDAFIKWVLRNSCNTQRCDQVPLTGHPKRGFASFPDDEDLKGFDPADRKFVAVAASHTDHPPILQAADSKWLDWAPILKRHGIRVVFICEADIRRFRRRKGGK